MVESPSDMANRNRQLPELAIRDFAGGMAVLVPTIGVIQLNIYQPMENPKFKDLLVDDMPQVSFPPLLQVAML
jgi:hypothetical protein